MFSPVTEFGGNYRFFTVSFKNGIQRLFDISSRWTFLLVSTIHKWPENTQMFGPWNWSTSVSQDIQWTLEKVKFVHANERSWYSSDYGLGHTTNEPTICCCFFQICRSTMRLQNSSWQQIAFQSLIGFNFVYLIIEMCTLPHTPKIE